MKKLILSSLFLYITMTVVHAQGGFFSFGPRVGVSQATMNVSSTINNFKYEKGKGSYGFHAGAFARISLFGFYIQPELLFTSTTGQIQVTNTNGTVDEIQKYNFNRVDVPIMIGYRFVKILRLNAGPVASFNVSTKGKTATGLGNEIADSYKKATFGFQAGVGVDLWKLVIDLKYEGSLSKLSSGVTVNNQSYPFAPRLSQVILSVGYKLY